MPELPDIYLISDRKLLPEGQFIPTIDTLLQAGLKMLQLREKDLSAAELLPLAQQLRELTLKSGCRLLINDRIDVALAVNADGVHLGGHSLPVAVARNLLGPDKLIGVSTHHLHEISQLANSGADFLTFGPVFYTRSKAAYGAPVGLTALVHAREQSQIPVFALGGVNEKNLESIKQVGHKKIAMISAVISTPSPSSSYQKVVKLLAD